MLELLIKPLKKFFRRILFPLECVVCKKISDSPLCEFCRKKTGVQNASSFPQREYLLYAATSFSIQGIRALIHALKYDRIHECAEILAEFLFVYARKHNVSFENSLLIPVPLSKERTRERGFNQAEKIAQEFIQKLEFHNLPAPKLSPILTRRKNTLSQTQCADLFSRKKNVRDAFALTGNMDATKNIFVIDDVFTTGSTMNEAVRTLKQNGAENVSALVVAKV